MKAVTTGPGFRLARAAVFAAVCVVASALGHALMSGQTVPVWAVAFAFTATTAGAWWLTGRERGAFVVTGSAMAAQCVLHTVFSGPEGIFCQRRPSGGGAREGRYLEGAWSGQPGNVRSPPKCRSPLRCRMDPRLVQDLPDNGRRQLRSWKE